MNDQQKKILIGKGLGDLKFGMSRDDVKVLLGKADEEETYSYTESDQDMVDSWHYDDLGISVSFEEDKDWRLVTIAISSSDYTLDGVELIEMKIDDVVDLLEEIVDDEVEYEDLEDEDGGNSKLITIDKWSLNFWFEDDMLSEVQWGPIYKAEKIVWPEIKD